MNYKTTFEGILETLDNQDIPYQKSFADILGNHWLGELTPETVKVVWEFHRLNNTEIYEFKRFEEDSTGAGMEEEKLMKEFFGIPPKALASLKRGVSVHGIGENSAYAKLSKQCAFGKTGNSSPKRPPKRSQNPSRSHRNSTPENYQKHDP